MIVPTPEDLRLRKVYKSINSSEPGCVNILTELINDSEQLRAFYASNALLKMDITDIINIFDHLLIIDSSDEHKLKINFLKERFYSRNESYNKARSVIHKVKAEDILCHIEYLITRAVNRGIGFDEVTYDEEVIHSQCSHLISTLPTIIKFLKDEKLSFIGKVSSNNKKESSEIIRNLSNYRSKTRMITEVISGGYTPIEYSYSESPDKYIKWFLQHNPKSWMALEVYRDLNYSYDYEVGYDKEDILETLNRAKAGNYDNDKGMLRIDFSRAEAHEHEKIFYKVTELLSLLYGGSETQFEYCNEIYTINDLITLSKKLLLKAKKIKRTVSFGEKALIRSLGLTLIEKELLELFCFNIDDDSKNPRYSPIIRKAPQYFLLPSHMKGFCFEKVIDKALSSSPVKVLLGKGKQKGHIFESNLETVIKDSGFSFGTIKRSEKNNIPEIDGLFLLDDDHLIVYEAKCSIKPEERVDAFSFMENHFVKAVDQLQKRVCFLTNQSDAAEERLHFSIKDKKIIPLIITNHSYFSGLGPIVYKGCHIHILDFLLFQEIIKNKVVPEWEYDKSSASYLRREVPLHTTPQILNALLRPTNNLKSIAKSRIQVQEGGVASFIAESPEIAFESGLKY